MRSIFELNMVGAAVASRLNARRHSEERVAPWIAPCRLHTLVREHSGNAHYGASHRGRGEARLGVEIELVPYVVEFSLVRHGRCGPPRRR